MVPRQIDNGTSTMQAWGERQTLELDGAVVTPGFAYNIARYFPSGTDYDKQKCIELMDKLGASTNPTTWYSPVSRSRTPTRPKSVPPSRNRQPRNTTQSRTKDTENFYITTNQREYRGAFGYPAGSARPRTARIFPSSSNTNSSSYQTDFNQKYVAKTEAVRTGTSTGNRRNNPHPFQAFMNWKFPSRLPHVLREKINADAWNEVLKEQVKSTYQYDYTGIPQGVDVSTVFSGDLVPSLYKPPYTLDSTARYSYRAPVLRNELSENLSQRFGCNKNNYKPAVGAVPTVSYNSPQMHLHGKTQYSIEYVDKSAVLKEDAKRLKSGPIPALEEYLKTAKLHERASLLRKLQRISVKDKKENSDPEWISFWSGPA